MEQENLPKHIAIIMDGNRRWARNKGLPVRLGHKEGEKTLEKIMENLPYAVRCIETGEIFKNATDAGKSIGVTRKAIERACKSPSYTSKGFHWEKVNTKA